MQVTLPTLVTFGSRRHSDGIALEAAKYGGRVSHINEEAESREGLRRDASSFFAEAAQIIQNEITKAPIVLLSLGRATVPGGIEEIARCCEELISRFGERVEMHYVGPSVQAARIFEDKVRIVRELSKSSITIPDTTIVTLETEESDILSWIGSHAAPFVCKAPCFSGGRGILLAWNEGEVLEAIRKLQSLNVNEILVSEFIGGLEVSSAIFRYQGRSTRFPPCWKAPTELSLRHPDSKVKLVGIGPDTDTLHQIVEKVAEDLSIEGFFYLEAITPTLESGKFFVIEGATRLSGNSLIESAVAPFYNLYCFIVSILLNGLSPARDVFQPQEVAVQHASFSKLDLEEVSKLRNLPAILEVQNEMLGLLPASFDSRLRHRISFKGKSLSEVVESARCISEALGDSTFASEILDTIKKCQLGSIQS